MRRGDVVIAAAKGEFGGKPRPYVVLQADAFRTARIILVGCTTKLADAPNSVRPRFLPSQANGLSETCEAMVDNPVTARRERVSEVVGALSDGEMDAVERALLLILGLAESR